MVEYIKYIGDLMTWKDKSGMPKDMRMKIVVEKISSLFNELSGLISDIKVEQAKDFVEVEG